MKAVDWHTVRCVLFRRWYSDAYVWAGFALMGTLFWGFLCWFSTGRAVSGSPGVTQRAFTAHSAYFFAVGFILLISAVGILASKAWGYLLTALVCAGLALLYAVQHACDAATVHLLIAVFYWKGYRWFTQPYRAAGGRVF